MTPEGAGRHGSRRSWIRERVGQARREAIALRMAAADPRTPRLAKWLAAAAVAYALSPIDLIPDFIPVLGHLDDLVIVPLLLGLALRMVPGEVMAECRRQATSA